MFSNVDLFIDALWRQSLLFTATQSLAAMTMVKERLAKTEKVLQCVLSFKEVSLLCFVS